MSLPRRAARAMLAGIFISEGLNQIRNPQPKAAPAEPVIAPVAKRVGWLPDDPEQVVKLDGLAKMAAGLGLVVGPFARPSALLLAGSLAPTTLAGHRFWERQDPQERASDQVHFMKNLAILGGLLSAALDTGGRPSVPWLAGRAARKAAAAVGEAAESVRGTAGAVGSGVAHGASAVAHGAGAVAHGAGAVGSAVGSVGSGIAHGAEAIAHGAEAVAETAGKAAGRATGTPAGRATGRAGTAAYRARTAAGRAVHRR
jgi:uncharacterized membrane protein YphA (DoxX/SURF4 family)